MVEPVGTDYPSVRLVWLDVARFRMRTQKKYVLDQTHLAKLGLSGVIERRGSENSNISIT